MLQECFFAYSSQPASLSETIELAIEKINSEKKIAMKSWKSTSTTGKYIISEICREIDSCVVFACDLTYLNSNVLFELGYAIAKNKRVWIVLDPNIDNSTKNYEKLRILTTIGYSDYSNAKNIVDAFFENEPYLDIIDTIYNNSIMPIIELNQKPKILYLKSKIETDASIALSTRIGQSALEIVIDDPEEVSINSLSWYVENTDSASVVISHFASNAHKNSEITNAKYAFVSGLALGFNKKLLMLAHHPYVPPVDFKDLLMVHSTARQCKDYVSNWLLGQEAQAYKDFKNQTTTAKQRIKQKTRLQRLHIGDYVAEEEQENLMEYFVETSVYIEALKATQMIIVGRKGTGKTANFYKIANEVESDRRNHVCIIKPISYEIEGILQMLKQSIPISEKGYIVESFWKFIIYTELAKSIYLKFINKPTFISRTREEEELYDYIYKNSDIITSEFSIKLQTAIQKLCDMGNSDSINEQRLRISEKLHSEVIGNLIHLLKKVLKSYKKVVVLIDNLDKAWTNRDDMNILCDLLYGLLGVSTRIPEELEENVGKNKVSISLILFLRSDIFRFIMSNAQERDKIPHIRIVWDEEMLLRIIEERFFYTTDTEESDDIWMKYFCASVHGVPTKKYILDCIIPRPRDIVYLCKTAIWEAINKGHIKIEEEDILSAESKYSQYVLDTIIVENGVTVEEIESVLYEFAGSKIILTESELVNLIHDAGIPDERVESIIEHLVDLSFLGIETQPDQFKFIYDEQDKHISVALAKKILRKRFKINRPFHKYLQLQKSIPNKSETISV